MGTYADVQVNHGTAITLARSWINCLHCLYVLCPGYRPILDAMTSFKAEKENGVIDIEVCI